MGDKTEKAKGQGARGGQSDVQPGVKQPLSNREIKEIAENFLTSFLQSWGQTAEVKIEALNKAIAAAGIKATFTQEEKGGKIVAGYECEELSEGERAQQLRERLTNGWWIGEYQAEAARIARIIREFAEAA